MKTRAEPRHKATIFWQKARRFADAAAANAAQAYWDPAVANAVNAAINLCDALCIHYAGLRSASQSHRDAMQVLDATEMSPSVRTTLRRHLESLLNLKGVAQYEGRLLDERDAAKALKHMDRAFDAASAVTNEWG